jgi:superfamily II DNA helicase RecQ
MCGRRVLQLREREYKGVVYCYSKAECEGIAEELGCGYYYAGDVD